MSFRRSEYPATRSFLALASVRFVAASPVRAAPWHSGTNKSNIPIE